MVAFMPESRGVLGWDPSTLLFFPCRVFRVSLRVPLINPYSPLAHSCFACLCVEARWPQNLLTKRIKLDTLGRNKLLNPRPKSLGQLLDGLFHFGWGQVSSQKLWLFVHCLAHNTLVLSTDIHQMPINWYLCIKLAFGWDIKTKDRVSCGSKCYSQLLA